MLSFCVAAGGPGTKKHMGAYAYTKKGLLCNWRMLVAWARKELAKALFPLVELRLCC